MEEGFMLAEYLEAMFELRHVVHLPFMAVVLVPWLQLGMIGGERNVLKMGMMQAARLYVWTVWSECKRLLPIWLICHH
jgi:hypothetical protein